MIFNPTKLIILIHITASAIIVTGIIAGIFFGLAFGIGGIASAILGKIADITSIRYEYQICSFLPLLGIIAFLLPNERSNI